MADEEVQTEGAVQDYRPADMERRRPPRENGRHRAPAIAYLGNNIEIYADKPLPHYDVGEIRAYEALGRGNNSGSLIALVCERHLTPRLRAISTYKTFLNPALAVLVDHGVVRWPASNQERYVILYNGNLGNPVLAAGRKPALDWKQERVIDSVLKPLVSVLMDFRDRDFSHGAIRPDNMFDGGNKNFERIILGGCLSAPPGYAQPVLYEPIHRAMADAPGRGRSTQLDDLYALGASLAVFMRGSDPLEGLSEEEIVQEKIRHGSYAALTGKDRFTGSVLELLRGLLNDDPLQRWNIDEVLAWMDGRRLSPKQAVKQRKAARPLVLGGERYLLPMVLAMDLEKHGAETIHAIEEGALEQWLTRSVEDSDMIEQFEKAVENARESGRGPGYHERLLSHVSCVLDPPAPIRYKGLRLFGEGVGAELARQVALKQDTRAISDMLAQGVALGWAMTQETINANIGSIISQFDACRSFLRQNKAGYGIERCLYNLNPEAPCMSEMLRNYYVLTPEAMLDAFEDICQKSNDPPAFFLDRHSIAFLSVKDRKVIDSYLYDLNTDEPHKRLLGNLKCLATIQKRSKLGPYPGLAKAFEKMLPLVYERYHDLNIREKLQSSIERFAATGDLAKIAGMLDNAEISQRDYATFRKAMQEYADLDREYKVLDLRLADQQTFGKKTGQDISAVVSSAIAAIVILCVVFMYLTNQSMF